MQLQKCIGTAVIAMGPERLLELVPVSLNAGDFTCVNNWLVPILKNYVVGASLAYYMDQIMPLAKSFQLASSKGTWFFFYSLSYACHRENELKQFSACDPAPSLQCRSTVYFQIA